MDNHQLQSPQRISAKTKSDLEEHLALMMEQGTIKKGDKLYNTLCKLIDELADTIIREDDKYNDNL